MFFYIHPSPIHKSVQKNGFNILIVPLHIIEGPPIPFFPNGPHQAEGGSSPSFLPFLAHKRSMPTQEVSFHRGVCITHSLKLTKSFYPLYHSYPNAFEFSTKMVTPSLTPNHGIVLRNKNFNNQDPHLPPMYLLPTKPLN